jgi:hypothetical protein
VPGPLAHKPPQRHPVLAPRHFPASNIRQWYVSKSRGRHSVTVYTDDKLALLDAVNRSDERMAATDLMADRYRQARGVMLRQAEERHYPPEPQRQRETNALER